MIDKLIKFPILKRLIPSIYKRYIFFRKDYFKEIIINDIIYNLDLRHFIDRRFFFQKKYEEELFNPMLNMVLRHKIDYFLDIGSCWGLYSLRLSNIDKNMNILAFDPIIRNIDRLKNSIKKNNIKNIKLYHTAIGSTQGSIELGATEDYSPNYKINEKKSVISEKCRINFLDNLFSYDNKYLILKIDTEGYEYEVLKGAEKLLTNNKCYCQIEIIEKNKSEIFSFLKDKNYKLISINKENKLDYIFSNFTTEEFEI